MTDKKEPASPGPSPESAMTYNEKAGINATGGAETPPEEVSSTTIETRLRQYFDQRILPIGILLYFSAFIDRSNMGNTRILGLTEDVDLTGNRFHIVLTCFFITYILFDIPCNLACRKLGPRSWLPFLSISFGIITMCIAFVHNYWSLAFARTLLGMSEAGLLSGVMVLFRRYYRRHEIATRIGILSAMTSLSGAFGGLLAYAFSSIPKQGLLERWRWVFLLEGIITVIFGSLAFAFLSNNPANASWLTANERLVATERLRAEHRISGRDPIDFDAIKSAILQPPTQLIALALISSLCCMNSVALFMPTLLHAMGFNAVQSQLMTIPPYAWGAVVCITTATISDRIRNRGYIMAALACCIITGFSILAAVESKAVRYFAIFLSTTGGFCGSPLLLSWAADNAAGPAVHAVVTAYVISVGSFGALISTWAYRERDSPRYVPGHLINMGFGCLMLAAVVSLTTYARWENRQRNGGRRDWRLIRSGSNDPDRLGHLHPDFRYTP